jgi:tetratricopeptide (TPR) repeat protein
MSDELHDEQQFLLSSLQDLEKERAAGDIEDNDYLTLREGYILRTAAVTRELQGIDVVIPTEPSRLLRRLVSVAVVLAIAVGSGVWVARSAGQRLPGQSSSGGIVESTANLLSTARQINFTNPSTAIDLYTQVLKVEPDNAEALTYRSWLLSLGAREAEGAVKQLAITTAVTDLLRAQQLDPDYPDPYCFLGIVYFRFLADASLARPQINRCNAMNPPVVVQSFVDAIAAEINASLKPGE